MERRRTDGTRRGDFKGEHRCRDVELTAIGEETFRERTDGDT